MKISSIAYSVPSKSYTNEEFTNMWINQLVGLNSTEKEIYRASILKLLEHTGAKRRFERFR